MTESKKSPLHKPALHESGHRHANGAAIYVDDMPPPAGMLVGYVVTSPVAHGRIESIDVEAARAVDGVHAVLTATDIPGENDIAPFTHDEPLLAFDEVHCVGQSIAVIYGESYEVCRAAAAKVVLEIESLPALLDLREAVERGDFLTVAHEMRRGDVDAALAAAPVRIEGEVDTGGQDHFYLESHASLVLPEENETYKVFASTQHPSEVQAKVAEVLGLPRHQVVVEAARMGGGFGGKETQGAHFAAMAALGARATRRPVKVWLNRDQDMTQTGKRHPFYSRYRAGFSEEGDLLALEVHTYSDGGWSRDLSGAILDRALFHLDNAYYVPALFFSGRVARTNKPSNTAFRGFGGPQGMAVVETVINRAAERLGLDPADVRRRNYYGAAPRNRTPYDQEVTECRLERIHETLLRDARYEERKKQIVAFNESSRFVKRGLAFQPVKFGISFTNAMLNQAGALVLIYADGSVQLNHGGTEMGQGLHTKMLAVTAHELGVRPECIRVMATATDKVPNTSATAASSGSDLNGAAVAQACERLRSRLTPIAAKLLGCSEHEAIRFEDGTVSASGSTVRFEDVVSRAYADQVSLSATGYYRTPGIVYDPSAGKGKPFHYFAYGGAVVEVEVSGFTGEHRLRRVDILHDVGDSLVPTIDRGQIEGGFIQGLGWLTCEELIWGARGELRTHSPDTYKIPAMSEAPIDFRVQLLDRAPQMDVVHGSKAVGEPPFMLALGVVTALRQAVAAFGSRAVRLAIPCTPEAVLRAIVDQTNTQDTTAVEAGDAVAAK